ncbi:MAG: hypothetical protein K2K92_00915 [Duncaniella sp.]|nr:hypothetical protein [Duncaniella sp.]
MMHPDSVVTDSFLESLSPTTLSYFRQWRDFLYQNVRFNRPESVIHAYGHCERVLLYALMIGQMVFGDDEESLTGLAHAAVFHDTRRLDDYLDTGHGARAAVYYKNYCHDSGLIDFHPESVFLMRYHDLDDKLGIEAIKKEFKADVPRVLKMYDIFKDADALDRWRLGSRGLDTRFLRTEEAKSLVGFSRNLVIATVPLKLLQDIEDEVNAAIDSMKNKKM